MQRSLLVSALLALVANFFWATNAIVGKFALASIPAFSLSQYRWWFALLFLAPFGIRPIIAQWAWYKTNLWALIGLSILSVTIYNTLQYWALEYTQPINVGALLAFMPIAIALVARLFGGRRQRLLEWLMIFVAVIGAVLVVTKGDFTSLASNGARLGEGLLLLAIISWAFYSILLKHLGVAKVHPIGLLTFFVAIGGVFIIPFWLHDILSGQDVVPDETVWSAIVYVSIFPSIVALLAWNKALSIGDATIAGLMVTSAPLFNALLSMWFLDHNIGVVQWFGISLVIIGVGSALILARHLGTSKQ